VVGAQGVEEQDQRRYGMMQQDGQGG